MKVIPLDRAQVLERLSRHKVAGLLARGDLETMLSYAQPRALRSRTKLFAAGDAGSALYVVLSGWIKLSRDLPNGRSIVLEVAGPGSMFGELAVLCALPRAADAVALTAAQLLAIDGRALVSALRSNPDAILAIVRMLGERLARTTVQMEDLVFLPAEPRLARALIRLAALTPQKSAAQLQIDLGLSQRELGEITGLARESINKLLAGWRDAGFVSLEGRTLTLMDVAALQAMAEDVPE
jgi:CRP/FNR family transcriptional regulator, cyclic AMP receptor protein